MSLHWVLKEASPLQIDKGHRAESNRGLQCWAPGHFSGTLSAVLLPFKASEWRFPLDNCPVSESQLPKAVFCFTSFIEMSGAYSVREDAIVVTFINVCR